MHTLTRLLLLLSISIETVASVVYEQPPMTTGALIQSSWWAPDDSDWDIYSWDSFTLGASHAITEVHWRGGYIYGGAYSGTVVDFTVAIYPSIAANSQPDVVGGPLVEYTTGGNAGQTFAGNFGGRAMYDYHFTLPSPFQAAAGTRYWIYILAWQNGIPEWGLCTATGGNGSYFRYVRGLHMYQSAPGDAAFRLISSDASTYTINASASPAGAGNVQGAGQYPAGSSASLLANANSGWGFSRWTEDGSTVSTNNPYVFTVNADRTLVANFVPAYTITTAASPTYGGVTGGGGTFNSGQTVTVTATPNANYTFTSWTEFGAVVSVSPNYSFAASANRALTANFAIDAQARVFDFDNAPVRTSLPIDLTAGGLSAHFTATGGGYSIQPANTLGFTPAGFSGLCVYPNSVFAADLIVDFSAALTSFSIMYCPQELGCDDSATMRATGFMNGVQVATNTATVPVPGTWPTGTLSLDSATPFDRVVVHYDARPPTCQDWGPIFLADNMIVALAATPPRCPGDLNGDRAVDLEDLATLLSHFGVAGGATAADGDLDGDTDVDLSDLAALLAAYGVGCP
ncbi:MAG: hypothetical protein IT450_22815 [Phycisphaerales bacterium]|nr:hypothetical protein [Phycisphaerales bacterium]